MDVLFGSYQSGGFLIFKRLYVHEPIVEETLVEEFIEFVVVSLGVEVNDGRFEELALFWLVNDDVLQNEELFEQLFEVLTGHFQVQVS